MEERRAVLRDHASTISRVLQEVCEAPSIPLVEERGLTICIASSPVDGISRRVSSDFGHIESVLSLPIPNSDNPQLWVGLHEMWIPKGKRKVIFGNCGLRIYVGARNERTAQILRLEWVAPEHDELGVASYAGKHAGHPHWHIDRAALIGNRGYLRWMESLTEPGDGETEMFDENISASDIPPLRDCEWLHRMHLPAHANWVEICWDGKSIPGPHQSEPKSASELNNWWAGSLWYLRRELSAMY